MKTKLTTTLLALVTVAAIDVAAAKDADLKTAPPKDVNLTAIWQINPKLSDDPREVLSGKRDESRSRTPSPPPRTGGGNKVGPFDVDVGDVFGNGTMSGGVTVGRGAQRGGSGDRPDEDPEPTNMRVPLDSFMATREQFEIEQAADAFTVRTVDETNTCKPGEPSKVPLQSGELVDQRCGWDGAAFVVEIKSPDGVTRTNRYQAQDGGKRLVMVSEIKGGRGQLRGMHIRRVYDRLY
jgi:hypothetical protein